MDKSISSLQNPLIKQIVLLQEKSRERRKQKLFIVEGIREISLALTGNYEFEKIVYCPEIASEKSINQLEKSLVEKTPLIAITSEVYQKIAYRGSTEGVLGIAKTKELDISQLDFSSTIHNQSQNTSQPLILIAEAPEKPGNIGALLRTADAAGVDAVIIANPKTDMYNPNIIRSSVGCLFTNKLITGSTSDIIKFLKSNEINIYCAALQASVPYHTVDFKNPTAIVVGTEAIGLSDEWRINSTQNIIIPMSGEIDSMNVSVAAGILVFEAKRQRGFY